MTLVCPCGQHQSPDGYGLSSDRSAIHDLILGQGLILIPCMRSRSNGLAPPDLYLHVFQLDPHQQEVDLANNCVLHVVLVLVVLKLYVQAFLDAHLHL